MRGGALGESSAKMTQVSAPANHERFFLALFDLSVPHDPAEVEPVCKKFDQAIVGPVVQPWNSAIVEYDCTNVPEGCPTHSLLVEN